VNSPNLPVNQFFNKTTHMKKSSTQHQSLWRYRWALLPALLAVLLGFALPSNAQTWTVGTGTSTYSSSGTPISPLGYYYPQVRVQYFYDTAALRAAGMPVNGGSMPIHQIAFNVGSLNGAVGCKNYTIGMMNAGTITALPTTGFITGSTGLPVVYSAPGGYMPSTGWNNINLSTPFTWNGTDGIIIEVCYTQGTTTYGPAQAGVYYHSTTGGVKSTYAYGTGAISYCSQPVGPTSNSTNRPNIRFTRLYPCTGPSSSFTTTPSGTTSTLCPGSSVTIVSSGYTSALNTKFQWWTSSSATGPWVPASGDSAQDRYTTPPMISNTYYRLVITCLNTGDSVVSSVVGFTFSSGFPVYASLPYFEGFENWSNGCATSDKLSSNNWTNFPITGDGSWRREDQGASASWYYPTTYAAVKAVEGSHCARHHSYVSTIVGNEGSLNLYFNASATTGNKDLSFYYRFNAATSSNYDSLIVELSTDGGLTFNPITGYGNASQPYQTWIFQKYNIKTTSAQSVIRFRGRALTTGHDDIYIDAVRIDPPCNGKPTAGIVDTNIIACKGQTFKLDLLGDTKAAGLTYQWQTRPVGGTSWSPVPGGNQRNPSTSITAPTEFRCIVTCSYSVPPVSDTTKVFRLYLAPFYYCYCAAQQNPTYNPYSYMEVGNVTIKTEPAGSVLLNNGIATPSVSNPNATWVGYEDYRRTVAPPTLIRDSTYRILATQTAGYSYFYSGGYGVAWLDANRDGFFQASEQIMYKAIPSQTNPTAQQTFTIGSAAPTGLTGLRVIIQYYTPVNPCGNTYAYGQVEDYLVKIDYQPCTGPVNPGIASISDTSVCRGYTIDLYDTSYERTRTGIKRMWEVSTNGGASYSAIPGSAQKDTMANVVVTAASKYRLRVICGNTGDTTYSNSVYVNTPDPVRCYPTSWAFPGGDNDSSDVGAFILGETLVNPSVISNAGPHLLNPAATKRRSDFTMWKPTELQADSTYRLAVFHTMNRGVHADALISVFMDFDNNGTYDVSVPAPPFTSELIFQGVSRWDSFFLDTKIVIPSAVIANVPTGMRVVVNNDVNPYGPGNRGSGNFVSGEVEDYVVIFRRNPLDVLGAAIVQNVAMFPNPTTGKFTVAADAIRPVKHMDITVTTMAGQTVISRSFENVGTRFNADLDLSNQAKGVYFVEIRADGEKINKKLVVR
jgi:hypothetical protein